MAEGEAVVALRRKLEQSEEEKVGLFRGIEEKSGQVVTLEKELVRPVMLSKPLSQEFLILSPQLHHVVVCLHDQLCSLV